MKYVDYVTILIVQVARQALIYAMLYSVAYTHLQWKA